MEQLDKDEMVRFVPIDSLESMAMILTFGLPRLTELEWLPLPCGNEVLRPVMVHYWLDNTQHYHRSPFRQWETLERLGREATRWSMNP